MNSEIQHIYIYAADNQRVAIFIVRFKLCMGEMIIDKM